MVEARATVDPATRQPAEPAPTQRRRPWLVGASVLCAVALGSILAAIGLPHGDTRPAPLLGPFVAKLSKDEIRLNLAGEGGKRYLLLSLNAEYYAYDERYVAARLGDTNADAQTSPSKRSDPLYLAMLKDAVLDVAATKSREEVTDAVRIEAFLEDVRRAVDPVLFPVCVGDSHAQVAPDSRSGLKVGESIANATLRGLLHDHRIHIDGPARTLRLDDGPPVGFSGRERDLRVANQHGDSVFLDVTGLDLSFTGTLPIGAPGRVKRLYRDQFLVQ